jgi:D-arabinonate dehydratase
MIIEKIESIPLKIPLARPFPGSSYAYTEQATIVTRVYAAGGLVGESYNNDDFGCQGDVVGIVADEIAPLLQSRDARNVEACWQAMLPVTKPALRDRRLGLFAMGCVDCAIWDLVGKSLNSPLYRLWGGYRDELPVIAIGGYYEEGKTIADYGREMAEYTALGIGGCKLKVGGLSPGQDAERARAARAAGGPGFTLAVDANLAWSRAQALEFTQLTADCDLRWFEEPCHWQNDRMDMAELRKRINVPICAGQSELTAAGCRDLMNAGAIDVCNIQVTWCGGPTAWHRVAGMAACHGVEMAHTGDSQFAPHLIASVPHGTCLEVYHPDRDPMFYSAVASTDEFRDGKYRLPDRPGWGLEINEGLVAKYRVD